MDRQMVSVVLFLSIIFLFSNGCRSNTDRRTVVLEFRDCKGDKIEGIFVTVFPIPAVGGTRGGKYPESSLVTSGKGSTSSKSSEGKEFLLEAHDIVEVEEVTFLHKILSRFDMRFSKSEIETSLKSTKFLSVFCDYGKFCRTKSEDSLAFIFTPKDYCSLDLLKRSKHRLTRMLDERMAVKTWSFFPTYYVVICRKIGYSSTVLLLEVDGKEDRMVVTLGRISSNPALTEINGEVSNLLKHEFASGSWSKTRASSSRKALKSQVKIAKANGYSEDVRDIGK